MPGHEGPLGSSLRRGAAERPGPEAHRSVEVEVDAEADIVDLVLVKLPIRRMAAEVFQQQLHVPVVQRTEELDPRARGQIGAPVVLLAGLHIDADHRPDARTGRPPAAGPHAPPPGPGPPRPPPLLEDAAPP